VRSTYELVCEDYGSRWRILVRVRLIMSATKQHGGSREGAGRKPTGRKPFLISMLPRTHSNLKRIADSKAKTIGGLLDQKYGKE
jgi:hypothetical protein